MNAVRTIGFVHSGGFSYINDRVHEALRKEFPDANIQSFDTDELPVWQRHRRLGMLFNSVRQYGIKACRSRWEIAKFGQHTTHFFEAVRSEITARLRRYRCDFTFQTQSLIDASQAGTPHFVYTDHTHRTNLYYPDFHPQDMYSGEWIDKEAGIYRHARVVFTMSSHVSNSLREHYAIEDSKIQCVGIGSNLTIPAANSLDDHRYARKNILFVGVDWQRKGGPQLVQAFRQVMQIHPDATLTIIGCSPVIGLPNVKVLGRLPLSEVDEHYRKASVFCMPTRNEPFGVVFVEAFAYRLPVVATEVGAVRDLIDDGLQGFRVPVDHANALAARLSELLGSPALCKRLGDAAYARMCERYTWKNTGSSMASRIRFELGQRG